MINHNLLAVVVALGLFATVAWIEYLDSAARMQCGI